MNELRNDKNLHEAVSRKEQKLPPMPADLNERLMESLSTSKENENHQHFSSLSLWRGRGVRLSLLAIAASIALLLIFNFGKEQTPQESIVAQQMVKPTEVPSQPIAEVSHLETVADELSEKQPATELSETTAETAEPTVTEKVETPRHFTSQRVLDATSPKDELFYLASTSYMAAPKSHSVVESEDASVMPFASKKESQSRPQVPSIKENFHKLTKKERKQMAVLGAITAKRWHIDINTMNTMRYGSRTVTPDFFLELRGDTLRSYLPYLGQAQVSQYSPAIGLNFEEPVRQYKESKPKSNKFTQLDIDVKTREDSYHYVIELYDSGEATIRVRSQYRDPVSFDGSLEIE